MKALVVLVLLAGHAVAEPQVHALVSTNGEWVASPPELAKELNAKLAADKKLRPWTCTTGFMTDMLVSWRCETHEDGKRSGVHRTFSIRDGKLVPFDLSAEVRSKDAFAAAMRQACSATGDPFTVGVSIGRDGLDLYATADTGITCELEWRSFYRLLRPDGVVATAARTAGGETSWQAAFAQYLDGDDALPEATPGKTPRNRFIAEGDYGVRDTQTNLVWAARMGTADVTLREATDLALANRGGGHTDWRLPRIGELAAISTADLAHVEPGDCTKGKNKYTITPLIHLSCGLVWSSASKGEKSAAWGFISGTPRLANPKDKTNYRALLVRGPD